MDTLAIALAGSYLEMKFISSSNFYSKNSKLQEFKKKNSIMNIIDPIPRGAEF